MRNSLYLAAAGAVISFALGAMVDSACANNVSVVHFHGTRAQVRSACGAGDSKTEGGNYTSCTSGTTGNSVTCDSKGNCTGFYTAAVVPGGGTKIPRATPTSIGGILAP